METSILMPVHPQFMDVFETFMNEEQKSKIRANNVRQYIEGIIDLLLKDKVTPCGATDENPRRSRLRGFSHPFGNGWAIRAIG